MQQVVSSDLSTKYKQRWQNIAVIQMFKEAREVQGHPLLHRMQDQPGICETVSQEKKIIGVNKS